jgi:crossover junction endodeoxyribonuclease RuvC
MTIIGIDPGTINTGFGVIKYSRNQLSLVDSGMIKTPAVKEMAPRLAAIYDELTLLIRKFDPDAFALETAFYGKNVQSALKIGYARGVSMLAAQHNNLETAEYSPREVKKSVVGNGAASKEQVQYMIKKLLGFTKTKIKFDETDALAVAVCHAFKMSSPSHKSGSWKKFVDSNPDKVLKK